MREAIVYEDNQIDLQKTDDMHYAPSPSAA